MSHAPAPGARDLGNQAAHQFEVLPGMTGTAEVRTGQRTVLEFLLRPMLRMQEAFRRR